MPSPESRILVNVTGVSRLLPPKGMGRVPHDLPSDFQSRKVDVDACAGPRDWPGPKRGEGSSFGRVRCGQQFHPRILDLASPAQSHRIARPAEDYVRSKVIENLAVVNYDTNNLVLAPYDWRLSTYNLEERDGYFSRLKTTIEGFKYYILVLCSIHYD